MATNCGTPDSILEKLVTSYFVSVRKATANHTWISDRLLYKLASDSSASVSEAADFNLWISGIMRSTVSILEKTATATSNYCHFSNHMIAQKENLL